MTVTFAIQYESGASAMNEDTVNNDIEMHMIIDDDLRIMHDFSINEDYPDSDYDEMNTVRVSIATDTETIAYMEFFIFYENRIDVDLEIYADGVASDAHGAMCALGKNGLLEPFDPESDSIEDMFDSFDGIIAHLHYVAVRDEYRKRGIGAWLLKNLPRILSRNYGISPRIISTTICPQVINWDGYDKSKPSFSPPNDDCDSLENKSMYALMEKIFLKNGYHQLGDTKHYYTKPSLS